MRIELRNQLSERLRSRLLFAMTMSSSLIPSRSSLQVSSCKCGSESTNLVLCTSTRRLTFSRRIVSRFSRYTCGSKTGISRILLRGAAARVVRSAVDALSPNLGENRKSVIDYLEDRLTVARKLMTHMLWMLIRHCVSHQREERADFAHRMDSGCVIRIIHHAQSIFSAIALTATHSLWNFTCIRNSWFRMPPNGKSAAPHRERFHSPLIVALSEVFYA
jgi:hypothetical protein